MVKSTSQVPKKCSTIAVRLKYLLRLRREAWPNTDRFRHAVERIDPEAYLTHDHSH